MQINKLSVFVFTKRKVYQGYLCTNDNLLQYFVDTERSRDQGNQPGGGGELCGYHDYPHKTTANERD